MIVSLDLSLTRTGWANFSEDGKLLAYGQIVPSKHLDSHPYLKIKSIVEQLENNIKPEDIKLCVEGIFLSTFGGAHNVVGFEQLARLSGAVINEYLRNHDIVPTLYKAVQARKLVDVKGNVQKAEVQLWAIRKFNLLENVPNTSEIDLSNYDHLIESAYGELAAEEIKRPAFKSRMDKISKLIEEATGIGEDVADAILLGQAYINGKKESNERPS